MDAPTTFAEYSVKKEYVGEYAKKRSIAIALYIIIPIISLVVMMYVFGPIGVYLFVPLFAAMLFIGIFPTYRRLFKIEYDYRVMMGEPLSGGSLDISEVYHNSSRKDIFSAKVADMEIIAPYKGKYRESADRRSYDRIIDASSSPYSDGLYYAVVPDPEDSTVSTLLFFEPNDRMLNIMHRLNRRTVIDDITEDIQE